MKSNKHTPVLIYKGLTHSSQPKDNKAIIILHGFDSSSSVYFMLCIPTGYAKKYCDRILCLAFRGKNHEPNAK